MNMVASEAVCPKLQRLAIPAFSSIYDTASCDACLTTSLRTVLFAPHLAKEFADESPRYCPCNWSQSCRGGWIGRRADGTSPSTCRHGPLAPTPDFGAWYGSCWHNGRFQPDELSRYDNELLPRIRRRSHDAVGSRYRRARRVGADRVGPDRRRTGSQSLRHILGRRSPCRGRAVRLSQRPISNSARCRLQQKPPLPASARGMP